MKNKIFFLIVVLSLISCHSYRVVNFEVKRNENNMVGTYRQEGSTKKIKLTADGFYKLYNPEGNGHYELEQCEYSSKGKWKQLSNDVLAIISENYYLKQEGFIYDLKQENELSNDSLYIEVKHKNSFHPVKYNFTFNYHTQKSVSSTKANFAIAKAKYLYAKPNEINTISFFIDANISGTTIYKGRIMFEILEQDINTEKGNHLTITLPNFDLCFFEFEPYDQEMIFIKDEKVLVWQGNEWHKL